MKVFVAGFFDLFHSGHVKFLKDASEFGDLYVSVGSDENLEFLKHKKSLYNEEERLYIVKSLKFVKGAEISYDRTGSDSFIGYLDKIKPDIFVVNDDSVDINNKKTICKDRNIELVILKREPYIGLPHRSSTDLAKVDHIPHRLDLVGFYDQTLLNSVCSGSVVLANIETLNVDDRSGMSSSTRNVIRKVFGNRLPQHITPEETAKIIFAVENPPENKYISGVVDQLGICLPGINRLSFDNSYWPYKTESLVDKDLCLWLGDNIFLKQTKPRPIGYNVFDGREQFVLDKVRRHSELGQECFNAIKKMDIKWLGDVINSVHDSQRNMIPNYESDEIKESIQNIKRNHLGVKLMGAGGYGYMMIVSQNPDKDFIKISVRK